MTRTSRSPFVALIALLFTLSLTPIAHGAAKKAAPNKAAKPAAAKASARADKNSRSERGREKADRHKASARDARADRRERNQRAADKSRDRAPKRETARERRERLREEKHSARKERDDERKLSRRERAREAERRRREEAARRAEMARQAAIARALAIARQRAADQALRDETAANILRDEITGEDPEVRRAALDALGNHAGSVVVMDPKSGRVYTVVNQDWALRRGFKPCSTIKLVTGLAGLNEKVIDSVQTVNISAGTFRLDLTDSLAYSNNGYFQRVSGDVGFDNMMKYARAFGLGERTGINHPNESPGRLPVFKSGYAVSHMGSHGDDIEVTTLQLANMASTIANGGHVLMPHLPRTPEENVRFDREVRRRLDVPVEHLQRLVPGMVGTVNYGTGKLAYDPTQTVAGKTGTCIGQGSWLGLFTSYAPVHDPRLAVAVVTRGSGERGRLAASVAGKIYRSLNHRFGNRGGSPLMANERFIPRPKVDARTAAALNDEDKEADAYVVSEGATDGGNDANAAAAPRSSIKSTLSAPATRPTEVTTRPAIKSTPSTTTMPPASGGGGNVRPRRVLETMP